MKTVKQKQKDIAKGNVFAAVFSSILTATLMSTMAVTGMDAIGLSVVTDDIIVKANEYDNIVIESIEEPKKEMPITTEGEVSLEMLKLTSGVNRMSESEPLVTTFDSIDDLFINTPIVPNDEIEVTEEDYKILNEVVEECSVIPDDYTMENTPVVMSLNYTNKPEEYEEEIEIGNPFFDTLRPIDNNEETEEELDDPILTEEEIEYASVPYISYYEEIPELITDEEALYGTVERNSIEEESEPVQYTSSYEMFLNADDAFFQQYISDSIPSEDNPYFGYTEEDFRHLLAVVTNECGFCSIQEQLFTGSVVLNRLNNKKYFSYADDIPDIIMAPGQYSTRYDGYHNKWEPTEENIKVVMTLFNKGSILPINVIYHGLHDQGDGIYKEMADTGSKFCYVND